MSWLSPKPHHTFLVQAMQAPKTDAKQNVDLTPQAATNALFTSGEKRKEEDQKARAAQNRKHSLVRYFASQLIGVDSKKPKVMRTGSRLLGFLLNNVDTREASPVRVMIPHGGESGGVTIATNSILIGQFSYPGNGEKVFFNFTRFDDPDGNSQKIAAQGFDAADYTAGIKAEVFSGEGMKVASQLGLTMVGAMTNVLTERQSMGLFDSSTTAKPTMKNALLQGVSQSALNESSRATNEIGTPRSYATVPEGKEIIIELTEDLKSEHKAN